MTTVARLGNLAKVVAQFFMNIYTCEYITLSEIGAISKKAQEAINAFCISDLDVSYGDSNRTMIDIPSFVDLLELALDQQGLWTEPNHHGGYTDITEKLAPYQHSVYVDLEN